MKNEHDVMIQLCCINPGEKQKLFIASDLIGGMFSVDLSPRCSYFSVIKYTYLVRNYVRFLSFYVTIFGALLEILSI